MRRKHPAFTPQRLSDLKGAQLMLLPPRFFITGSMILPVVDGAERDRELVAHLE